MRHKLACWLLLIGVVFGLTCAPQHEPKKNGGNGDKPPIAVPQALKDRIEAALEHVRRRELGTDFSFWTVFHAILGMGLDTQLTDPKTKTRVNAIEYVRKGGPIRGMKFLPIKGGRDGVDVETQAGSGEGQGHQDQFIAEMAQWGLPTETEFLVDRQKYTFADFIRYSKARASVTGKQELSWAVLIIGQYFGTDVTWTNLAGEKLSLEDVVRYEMNQSMDTATCGGTHRLFGLSWVYHLHLHKGGKNVGVWKDLAEHLDGYKKQARKLQNPDGSFSTSYLKEPGNLPDPQLRIGTSGHVLEWLSLALTDQELKEPWVQEAVNALVMMILDTKLDPVEGGALYHAAHGLYIYHARVFGPPESLSFMPLPPRE
jgi:hypothetical protein